MEEVRNRNVVPKEEPSKGDGVIFQHGEYHVESAGVEYAITNTKTGVVEETTSFLFEAIRLAKVYNKLLEEAYKFVPKSAFTSNGEEEQESVELPTQLN